MQRTDLIIILAGLRESQRGGNASKRVRAARSSGRRTAGRRLLLVRRAARPSRMIQARMIGGSNIPAIQRPPSKQSKIRTIFRRNQRRCRPRRIAL